MATESTKDRQRIVALLSYLEKSGLGTSRVPWIAQKAYYIAARSIDDLPALAGGLSDPPYPLMRKSSHLAFAFASRRQLLHSEVAKEPRT
jgi:hypothetical protein